MHHILGFKKHEISFFHKMMAPWTDSETFTLIELWGYETIQDQSEGCKKTARYFSRSVKE